METLEFASAVANKYMMGQELNANELTFMYQDSFGTYNVCDYRNDSFRIYTFANEIDAMNKLMNM